MDLGKAQEPAGIDGSADAPGDQQVDAVFLQPAGAVAFRHVFADAEQGSEEQRLAAVRMPEKAG